MFLGGKSTVGKKPVIRKQKRASGSVSEKVSQKKTELAIRLEICLLLVYVKTISLGVELGRVEKTVFIPEKKPGILGGKF